jgi:hypothetical protein
MQTITTLLHGIFIFKETLFTVMLLNNIPRMGLYNIFIIIFFFYSSLSVFVVQIFTMAHRTLYNLHEWEQICPLNIFLFVVVVLVLNWIKWIIQAHNLFVHKSSNSYFVINSMTLWIKMLVTRTVLSTKYINFRVYCFVC